MPECFDVTKPLEEQPKKDDVVSQPIEDPPEEERLKEGSPEVPPEEEEEDSVQRDGSPPPPPLPRAVVMAANVQSSLGWIPPGGQYVPPSLRDARSPLDQLLEMGFGNRMLNVRMLDKHKNDVTACVQELLTEHHDNEWSEKRH